MASRHGLGNRLYYINPDEFAARLCQIREFLHRMGRDTRQGEVAYELDGRFYRIRQFDSP
jgi:hypothetical protein